MYSTVTHSTTMAENFPSEDNQLFARAHELADAAKKRPLNQTTLPSNKRQKIEASGYIPTPKKIARTLGVLNIQNKDYKCFFWSVLADLHPVEHGKSPHRVTKYQPFLDELNIEGIRWPTPIEDIAKFEKNNNMAINVFGYEEEHIVSIRISSFTSEREINLLLITGDEKRHYCLIKDFSQLMSYQRKHKCKAIYCFKCLRKFGRQDLLDKHRHIWRPCARLLSQYLQDCIQHI